MKHKVKTYGRVKWSDAGSLTAVRRDLVKAKLADVVAVHMSLKNFWNPIVLWRAVKFIFANQRRKKILATMVRAKMGFNWRDSRPLKKQRQLGLLPKAPSGAAN
ncbi:MAG: hypothetical protein P4N60_19175 [Verrucomicrobiae bacterium]|nr:hypothetical protein [Verrucomicrobiae bacterium]